MALQQEDFFNTTQILEGEGKKRRRERRNSCQRFPGQRVGVDLGTLEDGHGEPTFSLAQTTGKNSGQLWNAEARKIQ